MHIHWTTINQIIEETPETFTYMLNCPEGFTWDEGAHTHLALKGFNSGEKPNKSLVRHMSISTLPGEKSIGMTTRIKENCSEFKKQLRCLNVGDAVALFKTHTNIPLKRENKAIYLLSCGVGLAAFRPLILKYLIDPDGIEKVHSLPIDSSRHYLFSDDFESSSENQLSVQYVDDRKTYYRELKKVSMDKAAYFYIVGSDDFLHETIAHLRAQGVQVNQMILDKPGKKSEYFFLNETYGTLPH